MKVLEKGRPQKGWSTETVCTGAGNGNGGCGAKLLVEQPDLYKTYSSSYDGSSDVYVTFTCSECGVETDLKGVPSNIKALLPSAQAWKENKHRLSEGTAFYNDHY